MQSHMNLFTDCTADLSTSTPYCIDETFHWQTTKSIIENFPEESDELLPGIRWGNYVQLYTPAFWKLQYLLSDFSNKESCHRLASNITEEIVMCILGGYGIPSEMGIMAFNRLKEQQLIKRNIGFNDIYIALSSPFENNKGKQIYYRFHNQKAKYIHSFLNRSDIDEIPEDNDIVLRNWLLSLSGIGLKTASWITRNWLKSNNVAILDVHVLRAGKLTGFFEHETLRDYLQQEKQYLDFCSALEVQAADMDAIIWQFMKKNTKLAAKALYS